jgi:hypothetical protein
MRRPGSPAPAMGAGTLLLGATWISPNKPSTSPFISSVEIQRIGIKT